MNCIVCDHKAYKAFEREVLNKYPVSYFQCEHCKHLFTEKPYWLDEAYNSAITQIDLGLLDRNILFRDMFMMIFSELGFDEKSKFIDFAGGYGVFTRLMRDKGWDCYWQDDYCENVYAKYFEASLDVKYTAVTAFEVFEHSWEPKDLIARLFTYSDLIFFSTDLQPNNNDWDSWYYIEPSTGQHISFATIQSMNLLAKQFDAQYYNHLGFHCLVRNNVIKYDPFEIFKRKGFAKIIHATLRRLKSKNLSSKLTSDYKFVKSKLLQETVK